MASWSLLQTLTNFDFNSVASDGEDIYFVQYGAGSDYQVFKYDTSGDTVTQISNSSSWSGTTPKTVSMFSGGNVGSAIQWFAGNLYALIFTTDAGADLRVYRYDGSGTAWTNVLTSTPGGSGTGKFSLFCDGSYLIVAPSNQTGIGLVFDWAKYSANGSSWSAATVSNSPAYINSGAGLSHQRWGPTYGQAISPVFIDKTSHNVAEPDPDAIARWFEWSAGTFSITNSSTFSGGAWSPTDEWLREPGIYIRDIYHWSRETAAGTIWKYAAALGDAWLTPTNHSQGGYEIFPVVAIGFSAPESCGGRHGDFALFTSGTWATAETVTSSAGIDHVVKINNGDGFLFGATATAAGIWGRSEAFATGPYAVIHSSGGIPGLVKVTT